MKIFGIGFSKTGTTSLAEALNLLNLKTIHYPIDSITFKQLVIGDYNLNIMKKYDGYVEGIAPFYGQLDNCFKNSKFILTIRDKNSWLRSIKNWLLPINYDNFFLKFKNDVNFQKMTFFYHISTFGSLLFNKERFEFSYDNHFKNVLDYFKNKKNLLVMDICSGDGWEKLCPFLNKSIPPIKFPFLNKSKNIYFT